MKILFADRRLRGCARRAARRSARAALVSRRRRADARCYVHLPVPFKRAAAWAGHDVLHDVLRRGIRRRARAGRSRRSTSGRRGVSRGRRAWASPRPTIVTAAGDGGFDIVALGAHGHSALAHADAGVRRDQGGRTSSVPVLLCADRQRWRRARSSRRVLPDFASTRKRRAGRGRRPAGSRRRRPATPPPRASRSA